MAQPREVRLEVTDNTDAVYKLTAITQGNHGGEAHIYGEDYSFEFQDDGEFAAHSLATVSFSVGGSMRNNREKEAAIQAALADGGYLMGLSIEELLGGVRMDEEEISEDDKEFPELFPDAIPEQELSAYEAALALPDATDTTVDYYASIHYPAPKANIIKGSFATKEVPHLAALQHGARILMSALELRAQEKQAAKVAASV